MRFLLLAAAAIASVHAVSVTSGVYDILNHIAGNSNWGYKCNPVAQGGVTAYESTFYEVNVTCTTDGSTTYDCDVHGKGQTFLGLVCSNQTLGTHLVNSGWEWTMLAATKNDNFGTVGVSYLELNVDMNSSAVNFASSGLLSTTIGGSCYSKVSAFDGQDLCMTGGCGTYIKPKTDCPVKYISLMVGGDSSNPLPENYLRIAPVQDLSGLQNGCSAENRTYYPILLTEDGGVRTKVNTFLGAVSLPTLPTDTTVPSMIKDVPNAANLKVNSKQACLNGFPTLAPTAANSNPTPAPTSSAIAFQPAMILFAIIAIAMSMVLTHF